MRRLALVAMLLSTACSSDSDCGDGDVSPTLTLQSADMTVEIATSPYALVVKDASGKAVLQNGSIGWTSGTFGIGKALFNGYFFFEPHFDPWREELRAVAVHQTDTEIDLTLNDRDDNCITITHLIRDGALRVEARSNSEPRAWEIGFSSPSDEAFLGFGERFDRVDHRGLAVYSWPEEGGLTSGEAEPPGPNNPMPNGGTMTYYPVPFFLSTAGYGFWLDTTHFNQFELATEAPDAWRAWEVGPTLAFEIYVGRAGDPRPWPMQALDTFTAATGRPMIPPEWSFGPKRHINRNDIVDGVPEIQAMRDLGLAITGAEDSLHFLPNGSEVGQESALRTWVESATSLGYKVIGYYNPYFASRADSPIANLTAEGVAKSYFLLTEDGVPGEVALISGAQLNVFTIDVTNPDAVKFFTDQFKRALDLGYAGWMYDFGEYVQPTWTASDGQTGATLHNAFPTLYDKAAHDALEQLRPGDWWYYSRSGYTGSQQYAPMTWSGDPDASFGEAEGLPAQVRATITLSMSGVAHVGSDIGGFKCLNNGPTTADGELLARWIEAGAMSSNMHDQDACTGGGTKATIWTSADARQAWSTYAKLHTRLGPYMFALAHGAHATGAPLVLSPWLLHPERRDLAAVDGAFYFGPGLYAIPALKRGATSVTTTLPPGAFVDWRDGAVYDGGTTVTLPAPLTELPLLLVDGTLVPMLDPSIDTLAPETSPMVVGPTDVADVYDVAGAISRARGSAAFTLADGGTLAASYDGSAIACAGCTVERLGPRVQRVRVEATGDVAAGGLALGVENVPRRVRWDLYLID